MGFMGLLSVVGRGGTDEGGGEQTAPRPSAGRSVGRGALHPYSVRELDYAA